MTRRADGELPPLDADAWLIWPRGGNSGDQLILDACARYLADRGIAAWISDGSIETAIVDGDGRYLDNAVGAYRGLFVFPGGGNIGIYPDNGAARTAIISRLKPYQRCLVFPQSAAASEPSLVHPQVRVWCRDAQSKALLDAAGVSTDLVPDACFYLGPDFPQAPGGEGAYFIHRSSGRETESIKHGLGAGLVGSDLTYRTPREEIIATLLPIGTVVADRLHGGLIAMMMGKKTIFLPVGYHKIAAFCQTWLSEFRNVRYCSTQAELAAAMQSLEPMTFDFRTLFTSHADPALNRFLLGI
jgi:exopolysaccharide biosynthesis predicted pyruvyltransferase EpsI